MHTVIPKLGAAWPEQGGALCGFMRGENGAPDYYLISPDAEGELEWGGYGHTIDGADSDNDGLKNTQAIIAANMDHPAAKFAVGVFAGDHTDCYLPAPNEMAVMRATCPELFKKPWYWTSKQYSSSNAWYQDFADGRQRIDCKNEVLAVRAVRRYYPLSDSTI